jgi:hypothetical protein
MTHRIVLRDAARTALPFGLFISMFSHGSGSALGFALCVMCVGFEISTRWQASRAVSTVKVKRV